MVEEIKKYFKNGKFNPPAIKQDIVEVEEKLGIKFPIVLRELYLTFNGFREEIAGAAYLLPLKSDKDGSSVLGMNKFFKEEYKQYYPNIDFSNYLFYGSSCSDELWAINLINESEVIAYNHHMEDVYEIVGRNIFEVYIKDQEYFLEVTKGV
ncbi:hypothetical protein GKZ28_25905 [Clostridium chromiireducens]|uniref:Knr4/Smi1-like domain-containing protein n=1 Tax=Clostridium chromiireducens TaxID=225345 RepID=A0A964W586_9CLOT|nr:SMI1/KNR4 family protein [Clostridium chromiireducens]MVX67090.1 hypothetical protein [Clostridium chromiireducens]